jgi:hypothetical protein
MALQEKVYKATKNRDREQQHFRRYQLDIKDQEKKSMREYLKTVSELRDSGDSAMRTMRKCRDGANKSQLVDMERQASANPLEAVKPSAMYKMNQQNTQSVDNLRTISPELSGGQRSISMVTSRLPRYEDHFKKVWADQQVKT